MVELGVLCSDLLDKVETLVLSEDSEEMKSSAAKWSCFLESLVEHGDFFGANAAILGEETELLAVLVDL